MNLFGKDLSREVALVAEIGVNHEGDVDVAMSLLRAAAQGGADAVKFQSYTPERFIDQTNAERFARVSRFALDETAHRRLAAEATALGVAFFSAAITEDWVPLIAELCPAIKIASGDLTFEPVIRTAARTGKPVIVSTGCGSADEVDRAVGWVHDEVGDALPERLVLMHCISAYPTPIEDANLLSIPYLAQRHGVSVGWSNHVLGAEACLAAVALGASVIEVHVTDRKTGRDFRDHELSFEPDELADLAGAIARVRASLGTPGKRAMPSEQPVREVIRKGLVAARDLSAGTVLEPGDLIFARPATEFASGEIDRVLGRTLQSPVALGSPITRAAVGMRDNGREA
jgi:N-acetylneuraminate synthase/N,N'-diacetyllegionaminate synthase